MLTVDEEVREAIVKTCQDALGEDLRSVTYFTREAFERLYLREDLDEDADLGTFVAHELRGFEGTRDAYKTSELGEYHYTTRTFDRGHLLRTTTDGNGVLVTTDVLPDAVVADLAADLEEILADAPRSAERESVVPLEHTAPIVIDATDGYVRVEQDAGNAALYTPEEAREIAEQILDAVEEAPDTR